MMIAISLVVEKKVLRYAGWGTGGVLDVFERLLGYFR